MKCGKIYKITIDKWPNKVPVGRTPVKYYSKSANLPKKYKDFAVLKKFGKVYYWVDKRNLKRIVKKEGSEKFWNLNGQAVYSGNIHWKLRATVVNFYHGVFSKEIKKEIKTKLPEFLSCGISFSVDIYEQYSKFTPDITNMWLLEKIFEDTVKDMGLLKDDSPEFVIESGRKRYHWVDNEDDRKLIFTIKYIKIKEDE